MGIRSRQKFSNIAQAFLIITALIVIYFLAALAALYLHMGLTE